jgi:PhoH-like ATPase
LAKSTYILDTSVYLTDANSLESYGNNDIVIPLKVLDEIDNHKKRHDLVGSHARAIIRKLDALREKGNLVKGIRLGKGKGIVTVKGYNPFSLPDDLDLEDPDNQIIATALSEKSLNEKRKVIVVSRDINMRVKCDSLGLSCEDYNLEQVVDNADGLYTGFMAHRVDEKIIDDFYEGVPILLKEENIKIYPNQFIMLMSSTNEKKTALARFKNYNFPLRKLRDFSKKGIWGIRPRNKEQQFALDLLMDPEVPVVTLVGKAGTGKTLKALCSALEQTLELPPRYRKVVVTKPVEPVGKDIGFLPGTMQEKLLPWLAPIQDNLQFLFGDDRLTLEMHIEEGKIEIEAVTYIRGRSIANAYMIIDEVQNMTQHEIKTVLTRVGEGTKIILTGDIDQIDNVYVDETNNALSYVVEKLKNQEIAGHVTLLNGERSKVASIAAEIL